MTGPTDRGSKVRRVYTAQQLDLDLPLDRSNDLRADPTLRARVDRHMEAVDQLLEAFRKLREGQKRPTE